MTDEQPPDVVQINGATLKGAGFTESGLKQFTVTAIEYTVALFSRALKLGEADKAPGMQAEVGHEHVRAAAHSMARSFGTPRRSSWSIAGQIVEYLATAVAGVGGGHLGKTEGTVAFGIGLSVAIVLITVRLARSREE